MSIVPTAKKNARHTIETLRLKMTSGNRISLILAICKIKVGKRHVDNASNQVADRHFFTADTVISVTTPKVILNSAKTGEP